MHPPDALATTDPAAELTGEQPILDRPRPRRVRIEFGARTDPGRVRKNNEDHYLVARLAKAMRVIHSSLPDAGETHLSDDEGYLVVVADGMGGAAAGKRAAPWPSRPSSTSP